MADYIDGFVLPIPRDRLDDYKRLVEAVAEIWKKDSSVARPPIRILSLGSGSQHHLDATNFTGAEPEPKLPNARCPYAMRHVKHVVKMIMDGNANTVSFQAKLLLSEGQSRFQRIQHL